MKNTSGLLVRMAIVVLMNVPLIASGARFADTGTAKAHSPHYLRLNEINAHAARDFASRFPVVTTEKWLRTTSGYAATFTVHGMTSNVYYNRTGHFINIIRYYEEGSIPSRLKNLLRREFSDYTIVAATELINEKERSFYFHIKNKKRIKTVKVEGESVIVTADYRNAEQDLQKL